MKQMKQMKQLKTINWPTSSYFNIKQLHTLNTHFNKKITLRVRLAHAIEEGIVAEIGSIPGGHGRPPKVYALTPVTQLALDHAEQAGIVIPGESRKLVNVVAIGKPVSITPTSSEYSKKF